MPLTLPTIDDRKYQQLLDEALSRIPVHNPEWTNFNKADPGVTLLELFSFLTESLLYRANQIPERNRLKFLQLLGVPLQPASSARGLVAFRNERGGPPQSLTLTDGVEVRAGQVPFRTERGLDVLPVEAAFFYKRSVAPEERVKEYYQELYASFTATTPPPAPPDQLQFYETTPFSPRGTEPLDLNTQAIDRALWVALLLRPADRKLPDALKRAREELKGKVLTVGLAPAGDTGGRDLVPNGQARPEGSAVLQFQLPRLPPEGKLPESAAERNASWRTLATAEVPAEPTVVDVPLPSSVAELELWTNLDPLEAGTRDFPPALDDEELEARVITWVRINSSAPVSTKLLWAGINAAPVTQRERVTGELLPEGTGEPDQAAKLARAPVLPGSVKLTVIPINGTPETWEEIDDLMSAGPEVAAPDPRLPPGTPASTNTRVKVFKLDAEAGELRFGDGAHGARPPPGATLRVDYDQGVGRAGNVGPGTVTSGPALPPGLQVENPLPTWGGADAESVSTGEKHITRFLQHRDRLVTAQDFEAVTLRTPGVAVGRVEVLPAFHPALSPNEPGDAPGAVTVMAIPRFEPDPAETQGTDGFLDAIACWLAPRRLVTTEIFVRRPVYKPVWVTVGLEVVAGVSQAQVREAVKAALTAFLSPLPPEDTELLEQTVSLAGAPQAAVAQRGWPLRKAVVALELAAVASRVAGVALVRGVRLGLATGAQQEQVPLTGLQLPRLAGLAVAVGDPPSLDELRGTGPVATGAQRPFVSVPVVPEECR
ncbi:baseplate J/gp47 family protein [Pyxidicoccus xibeiensis]|uniref:baseplate J/gp47 family protein n=1 Tax=Pyxidicoccus xibeiensis TaxID=2906759 RepID=UPI0020A78ED6|nr:baseplate J/gp47 family protein [Pyxidicoccus xibeiensis]MCP3137358.1 baseplate J/gp47 family protein [Pyxidicoccus xibeiensis]